MKLERQSEQFPRRTVAGREAVAADADRRAGDHREAALTRLVRARRVGDHEFKPYADDPSICVAERPRSGNTCNRSVEDHIHVPADVLEFLERNASRHASADGFPDSAAGMLDALGVFDDTADEAERLRRDGIGPNHRVLDPHDGYRQDNQLWFGTCDTCGESVTSSRLDGGRWMHRKVVRKGNPPGMGGPGDTTTQIDHCPKGRTAALRHASDAQAWAGRPGNRSWSGDKSTDDLLGAWMERDDNDNYGPHNEDAWYEMMYRAENGDPELQDWYAEQVANRTASTRRVALGHPAGTAASPTRSARAGCGSGAMDAMDFALPGFNNP